MFVVLVDLRRVGIAGHRSVHGVYACGKVLAFALPAISAHAIAATIAVFFIVIMLVVSLISIRKILMVRAALLPSSFPSMRRAFVLCWRRDRRCKIRTKDRAVTDVNQCVYIVSFCFLKCRSGTLGGKRNLKGE